VILFLDTEFTDLAVHARLLSIAIVGTARSNIEFYAEVTDRERIEGASWFAVDAVLPQFGHVAYAACSYAELCKRLIGFFDDLSPLLVPGECIELAFGYHLDWDLVVRAIQDGAGRQAAVKMSHIRPLNVYDVTGSGPAKLAAEAYLKTQGQAPFSRHHALCDARALREAYMAAAAARTNWRHQPARLQARDQSHVQA
jgi:3' exoribonuclease, RNase T-like